MSASDLRSPKGHRRLALWWARCDQSPLADLETRFLPVLSAEERERQKAFAHPSDRHVYLLAHAMLRSALARYLQQPPESFQLDTAAKPRLPGTSLEFSISHTSGLAVCCLADGVAVGVDIEKTSRATDLEKLIPRYLTVCERAALEALPNSSRADRLVASWTCKEALLKAAGHGLAAPMKEIELQWDAGGRVKVSWPRDGATCDLRRFTIGEYAGAVATMGTVNDSISVVHLQGSELEPRISTAAPDHSGCYTLNA